MNQIFAAISIGRRSIAAAIFKEENLHFWEVRSFQASAERARSTVASFLNWILETFNIEAGGLELLPENLETRATALTRDAEELLRDHGIPVLKASETDLFSAYGEPSLRSRAALRQVAGTIFPQLKNPKASKELLDAAILGLHLQTERLLLRVESESGN
jgi:hypothetical protein